MNSKAFYGLLIVVFGLFVTHCRSHDTSLQTQLQNNSSSNNSVNGNFKAVGGTSDNSKIEVKDNGIIVGELSANTITDLKLDTVLDQPAPKIWFVFDCQQYENTPPANCLDGKTKKELTPELKQLAANHWKYSLEFQYKDLLKKFKTPQEDLYSGNVYFNKNMAFHNNLKNSFIDAPLGNRKISAKEADDIFFYVRDNAKKTVQDAMVKLNH